MKTINSPITFSGEGIHTGIFSTVRLIPSYRKTGINFIRTDVNPNFSLVPARLENLGSFPRCTSITNSRNVSVLTIEHLMAAIYMMEIENLTIEISGPEVPIMDGGSLEFLRILKKAGRSDILVNNDNVIFITSPVRVMKGNSVAELVPFPALSLIVSVHYPNFQNPDQRFVTKNLTMEVFEKELAPEKTYALFSEIEKIKKNGLGKGGNENNTRIVYPETEKGNGMARHKALDIIGDMALTGKRIRGQYRSHSGGHELNHLLLKKVMAQYNQAMMSINRPERSTALTP